MRRIHDAGFPRDKRIEEFGFEANSSVSPAVIHQLATCAWVKAGHPLCLIGDSGTGKSHLLIGLGTAAAEAGYRVRYTLASKLVNELAEAAEEWVTRTAQACPTNRPAQQQRPCDPRLVVRALGSAPASIKSRTISGPLGK